MWHSIWDKISWTIAYALLPITYPIYWFRERKEEKKKRLSKQTR